MKKLIIILSTAITGLFSSCNYLDIVPDDVPTMDMVFDTRINAERMLVTCYNYLPVHADHRQNPGFLAGDEMWNCTDKDTYYTNQSSFFIGQGLQNTNDPYLNYWSGGRDGRNMWVAIRDCNTFIDNVETVPDLGEEEMKRWKAEVMVLKAFYHYWMLQLYGPIPFIDRNLDMSVSPEEVRVSREPVDQVVEKIVSLLDEAIDSEALPPSILISTEMGRLTLPAAKAIKAKVLMLAASPLFNGNTDFTNYKNKQNIPYINPTFELKKWERAAAACKEAIDCALANGHDLYEFDEHITMAISDVTRQELTLRNTITSRFGKELIWGCSNTSTTDLMGNCNTSLTAYQQGNYFNWTKRMMNPTLDVVEQFYSNHGVPIDEDKDYDYEHRYEVSDVPEGHEYYVEEGGRTVGLHYYREPRFYAYVGFDRGKWFNMEAPNDRQSLVVRCRATEVSGRAMPNYSITGYFAKKLVSYKMVVTASAQTGGSLSYAFPIVRLSDLYLLYAEALNECKAQPDASVYEYIQKVRTKAGLDKETGSLVNTWATYSINPTKPTTQNGMREIIRRERMIELAFEAQRFYDLRRWKLAMTYFNRPIRGWNVSEKTEEGFYQPMVIFAKKFTPRDYFWPIRLKDLYVNTNLDQSPMW